MPMRGRINQAPAEISTVDYESTSTQMFARIAYSKLIAMIAMIVTAFGWLSRVALAEDNTSILINGFSTNIASVTIGSTGTNNSLQIVNAGFLTTSGNG